MPEFGLTRSCTDHGLSDLFYRHAIGELPMDMVGSARNRPRKALTEANLSAIPCHHRPITRGIKPQQEAQFMALVEARAVANAAKTQANSSVSIVACSPAG